jgi:hypothetical protein
MPLRNGSRQIAIPPPTMRPEDPISAVKRTQYTPSFEPDDEDDSILDPRQTSGNSSHGCKHSQEATREPSRDRSLSEINREFNTVAKMLHKLVKQGNRDDENQRQRDECMARLEELLRLRSEKLRESTLSKPKKPPQADNTSPLPPVEASKNFDINSNKHSCAQGEVSAPPLNNTSTTSTQEETFTRPSDDTLPTSIQGEDPKDPGDKNIPNTRQGRVSLTVKPSSTPNIMATIAIDVSPDTTPRLLYEDLQDSNFNLGPDNVWYRPPKSFSAPALISKADETSLVETRTDKEAPTSNETAKWIVTMDWDLVPLMNRRSYSWNSKRKKRLDILPINAKKKFFFFFFFIMYIHDT